MYPGREINKHQKTAVADSGILSKTPGTKEKKGKSMQSTITTTTAFHR
jgi:hypothetical protein